MNTFRHYSRRFCVSSLVLLLGMITAGASAQVTSAVFSAMLQPTQETPPILMSNAFGNAFLTFDVSSSMLCYSISYTDGGLANLASGETAAHIHGPAEPGVSAGVQFDISPNPSSVGSPKEGCVGPLTDIQIQDLRAGLYYINIHSVDFPGGEIRGQILFERAYQ